MIDISMLLRATGALLLVVGLIVAVGWLGRRYSLGPAAPNGQRPSTTTLATLPGRRMIIRVALDGVRYDLLLAPDHSLILDRAETEVRG